MKRIIFLSALVYFSINTPAFSQHITYSDINKEDSKRINFEILGNFGSNYIVYKNRSRKHLLTVYDKDMHITDNVKLDFISDKTFNVDFISYPDYFFIVYQYSVDHTLVFNWLTVLLVFQGSPLCRLHFRHHLSGRSPCWWPLYPACG